RSPSRKEHARCPGCQRWITISKDGRAAPHVMSPGKPCPKSKKCIVERPEEKPRTPYYHPEPRLVGEPLIQIAPSEVKHRPFIYRKQSWQSFTCAGCGEVKWILEGTLTAIIRRGTVTFKQLKCWPCREGLLKASDDELTAAITNLARRRRKLKLK
ncbi:hypothetical protein LCGC14_2787940, partial [marine sediment metagenome]